MAQGKYAKYVTELEHIKELVDTPHKDKITLSLLYDEDACKEATHSFENFIVYAPGACFLCGYNILWRGEQHFETPVRSHAEEMLLFFGTDPKDPTDLGGEVECWLGEGEDAEKYIITKSTCIVCPAGLVHGPIAFRKVNRPFIFNHMFSVPSMEGLEYVDAFPPAFSRDK